MSECPYPTIRFIAYDARNPAMIFVADPSLRGRYVYTDRSVAIVPCSQCHAIPGEPCKSREGQYRAYTHCVRRDAARWKRQAKMAATDVLKPHLKLKLDGSAIEAWCKEWETGTDVERSAVE